MPDSDRNEREYPDCAVASLEANVDPPDRTPDSYVRAERLCPHGCGEVGDCKKGRGR